MWFDAATDRLWTQAIRPSVYDAGYKPVRVDAIEHSNKIDDIRWKEDNFPGFKRALTNRIEALFGKGSVKLDKQD